MPNYSEIIYCIGAKIAQLPQIFLNVSTTGL